MANLAGKKIAFLATDMVEQVELTEPWKAVEAEGATPELVSLEEGEIQGFNHYDKADTFSVDKAVADASADDYDALLLPGGVGNPDTLRTDENAVGFVRSFLDAGKPVAAICHAPWMLVEADVVRGRKLTSTTRSRGTARSVATTSCSRCGGFTARSAWAGISSSPPSSGPSSTRSRVTTSAQLATRCTRAG